MSVIDASPDVQVDEVRRQFTDFKPTSDQINALPDGLRCYIHDLETRSDPSGDLRELVKAKDEGLALVERVRELDRQLAETALRERALREALEKARPFLEQAAVPMSSYGMGGGVENPHDFVPDEESNTPEELAAHKAACEAWDKGELVSNSGRGCEIGENFIACHAGWGMGAYTYRDAEAEMALAAIKAALAAPAPSLEPIIEALRACLKSVYHVKLDAALRLLGGRVP